MKLRFIPLLLFAVFCLSGGLLYVRGIMGAKLLKSQAYFTNTTLWFVIGLMLACFGLYLIRYSLIYAYSMKGVAILGFGAMLIFGGYFFIEQFML